MKKRINQHGFSVIELLAILLILTLLAGVGFYVYKKKSNNSRPQNSDTASFEVGTSKGISQLSEADLEDELAAEAELASAEEEAAQLEADEVAELGAGYEL